MYRRVEGTKDERSADVVRSHQEGEDVGVAVKGGDGVWTRRIRRGKVEVRDERRNDEKRRDTRRWDRMQCDVMQSCCR